MDWMNKPERPRDNEVNGTWYLPILRWLPPATSRLTLAHSLVNGIHGHPRRLDRPFLPRSVPADH